eukprot:1144451-Pelagomonas_calceolata.AAC.9
MNSVAVLVLFVCILHRTSMQSVPTCIPSGCRNVRFQKKNTYVFPGSCLVHNGRQEIGAGVYYPLTDNKNSVEPNGAGITITITRAELAAIAAAITSTYANIASDSLTSLHQI